MLLPVLRRTSILTRYSLLSKPVFRPTPTVSPTSTLTSAIWIHTTTPTHTHTPSNTYTKTSSNTNVNVNTNANANTNTNTNTNTSTLHTTDSYSKDIDSTPAEDPGVHRVDPSSSPEMVQLHRSRPGAATGAGAGVTEGENDNENENEYAAAYRSLQGVDGDGSEKEKVHILYEVKGGRGERYGSRMSWAEAEEKGEGGKTSGAEEGPAEGSSGGRR